MKPCSPSWIALALVTVLVFFSDSHVAPATAATCWATDKNLHVNLVGAQPLEAVTDRSKISHIVAKTYYAEQVTANTAQIWRIGVDGSGRESMACSSALNCPRQHARLQKPALLKLEDIRVKYLYWYDAGSMSILRVPLVGATAPEVIVCQSGCGTRSAGWFKGASSIVIDPTGTDGDGNLYWSDPSWGFIGVIKLTGAASVPNQFVGTFLTATFKRRTEMAKSLVLDRVSSDGPWLYWAERDAIVRAHLTNTGSAYMAEVAAGNLFSLDLKSSSSIRKLYFSDGVHIWRSDVNGANVQMIVCPDYGECTNVPIGSTLTITWIYIHAFGGTTQPKLYWFDSGKNYNRFFSAASDGDGPTLLLTGASGFPTIGQWTVYARLQRPFAMSVDTGAELNYGVTWSEASSMPAVYNFNLQAKRIVEVVYAQEQNNAPAMIAQRSGFDFLGFERATGTSTNALVWSYAGRMMRATADNCLFTTGGSTLKQLQCPSGCAAQKGIIGRPESIRFDTIGGKMYWIDAVFKAVLRSNLDGTNVQVLMCEQGCPSPIPRFNPSEIQISRATEGPRLWVVDEKNVYIWRVATDGSSRTPILCRSEGCTTSNAKLDALRHLVVDDRGATAVLYFQDAGPARAIMRINSSGFELTTLLCSSGCGATRSLGAAWLSKRLLGMQIDVNGAGQVYLYWADRVYRHIARLRLDVFLYPDMSAVQGLVCQVQSGVSSFCVKLLPEIGQLHGFYVRTISNEGGAPATIWFSYSAGSIHKIAKQTVSGGTTAGIGVPAPLYCSDTSCGATQQVSKLQQAGILTATNTSTGVWQLYWANRYLESSCGSNPWCPGEWSIYRGPANGGTGVVFVSAEKLIPEESSSGLPTL